jgi:hypothetical protein
MTPASIAGPINKINQFIEIGALGSKLPEIFDS